ncbi:MAG: peptide ABC transporter permease [Anaerolinea sp.]|nr:peptide ABC transporter permease [Anaerolinea sp.]
MDSWRATRGRLVEIAGRLARQRLAVPAFGFIFLVLLAAIFADVVAPYDPLAQSPFEGLRGASWDHPLGTDQLGRDVLSRLIFGSRIALMVGVGAVAFGAAVGMPLGLVAGYARGFADDAIMRCMDAIVAFPGLILALGLVAALGQSPTNLIVAIGIANVPWIARIVRAQVLSVRELDYVLAARGVGATHARILRVHVFPNTLAPVIVQSTLGMGYAVLTEAGLSFIGAGIAPPTPTWGSMLQFGFGFLNRAPMLSIVPGVAIFLLVLCFNLLGDILRDELDPRLRGRIP